jgi:alpha-beta hydrolase superfamily lysophospholipase
MGLMIEQGGAFDEYEAIALPPAPQGNGSLGSAVFVRRSARPSRRAVLHLHDLAGSFAPSDLASWYNERGFHFYVTDLDSGDSFDAAGRRQPARGARPCFATLDAACLHLREVDGIDAIILSAQEHAAAPAAAWCHARRASNPVDALILANPEFGKGASGKLDIPCPVLVIAAAGPAGRSARRRRGSDGVLLGQHVTWLHVAAGPDSAGPGAAGPDRRRVFDEMGRWLGAYMYGKVRDQLL